MAGKVRHLQLLWSTPTRLVCGQLAAQLGQGAGEQAGDVHFGDPELFDDLGLGLPAEEPQLQDPPFPCRKYRE